MNKLLTLVFVGLFLVVPFVFAAPTSTTVQNLYITALKSAGNPCLVIGATGLIATSTCGTGGVGGTTTTIAGLQPATDIFLLSMGDGLTIATSAPGTITLTNNGVLSLVAGGGVTVNNATGTVTLGTSGLQGTISFPLSYASTTHISFPIPYASTTGIQDTLSFPLAYGSTTHISFPIPYASTTGVQNTLSWPLPSGSTTEADPIYSANSYAVGMDQGVATSDSPSFATSLTVSGASPSIISGNGGENSFGGSSAIFYNVAGVAIQFADDAVGTNPFGYLRGDTENGVALTGGDNDVLSIWVASTSGVVSLSKDNGITNAILDISNINESRTFSFPDNTGYLIAVTGTATGTDNQIVKMAGGVPVWGTDDNTGGGGATTTINTVDGPTFLFKTGANDTNIGLALASSSNLFTWTPSWIGTLADARITSAANWNSKATSSITISAGLGLSGGGDLTANRTLTLNMAGITCGGTDKVSSISATGTAICTTDQTGGGSGGGLTSSTPFSIGYVPYATTVNSLTNSAIFQSNGSVGIGTTTPVLKLGIEGGIYANEAWGSGASLPTDLYSSGDRAIMFWYPKLAAFGAFERDTGSQLESSIGGASALFGYNNTASGYASFVGGYNNKVIGDYTVSFGSENTVDGDYNSIFGYNNVTTGTARFASILGNRNRVGGGGSTNAEEGFAIGFNNVVEGNNAGALGEGNQVLVDPFSQSPQDSIAIGDSNVISTVEGIAIGAGNKVSDDVYGIGSGVAIGNTNISSGTQAMSYGKWVSTVAKNALTFGIGVNASKSLLNTTNNSIYFGSSSTVPTLVITGNITNSLTGTGNVGIATTNPSSTLHVLGNAIVSGITTTTNLSIGALSGILKGTGGVVSTATQGTDYGIINQLGGVSTSTIALVAGTNISIATTSNSITINSTGGGSFTTTTINGLSTTAYIFNSSSTPLVIATSAPGTVQWGVAGGYEIPTTASTSAWNTDNVGAGGTTTTINGVNGPAFVFLQGTNDTNITLALASSTNEFTWTVDWTGTLADDRIASAATWNGMTPSSTQVIAGTGMVGGGALTGNVTLTNNGVLSLTGGGGVTVSSATGTVTLGTSGLQTTLSFPLAYGSTTHISFPIPLASTTGIQGTISFPLGVASTSLTAGRSLTLTTNDIAIDSEVFTPMLAGVLTNVSTTDSGVIRWKRPLAFTITRISCDTSVGTTTIQLDERAEATPNTAGTDVMTGGLICDTNTEATTTFANATIAANALLNLDVDGISNYTTTTLHIYAEYTIDD